MLILLLSVLHLLDEALCWLEAWQVVSWDGEGCVLRDVTSGLSCTVLDVEATEATQVNILLVLDEALLVADAILVAHILRHPESILVSHPAHDDEHILHTTLLLQLLQNDTECRTWDCPPYASM